MTTQKQAVSSVDRAVRNPWLILIVVLTATFMQLLDISIVGVAVASIQDTLHASYSDVQLVYVAYEIGFASCLILAARLGDIYGRRRLFLIGMGAFTLASIACGLAPNINLLLIARTIQGISSALMFAQVLAIIQVLFSSKDRGSALGAYGTTIGLGTILGPVVGGLLIQASFVSDAWRPIFLVNVPIGVAAFIAAWFLLPESKAPNRPRLDVPGAVLSATGLGLVLYGLAEGRTREWPAWIWIMMAVGVVVLIAFAWFERRLSLADKDPILDTRLFRDRAFRVGALLNLLFYAGVPGFFLVFSFYLQTGQGFSALGAGLAIFAYSIGAAITASNADAIAKRIGNRVLTLGAGLLVLGMLTLIATTHWVGIEPHVYSWIPAMAISGLGFGLFVPPVIDIVLVNVDRARAGIASGALATMQQVGGAIGVAFIGIIFFGLIGTNASQAASNASPAVHDAVVAAGVPDTAATDAATTFERCFTERARSTDPTVTPAGCEVPANAAPELSAAYQRAAKEATAHTFATSFAQTLWYQVIVYLLVLALIWRLPKVNPRQLAELEDTGISGA